MDLSQILQVLETIGILVIGGFGYYFKQSAKVKKKAAEVEQCIASIMADVVLYIKQAEEDYKDVSHAGGQKFEQVVNKLYELVPDALHSFITKEMIEDMVQNTFEEMEKYVAIQLDKVTDSIDTSKVNQLG